MPVDEQQLWRVASNSVACSGTHKIHGAPFSRAKRRDAETVWDYSHKRRPPRRTRERTLLVSSFALAPGD